MWCGERLVTAECLWCLITCLWWSSAWREGYNFLPLLWNAPYWSNMWDANLWKSLNVNIWGIHSHLFIDISFSLLTGFNYITDELQFLADCLQYNTMVLFFSGVYFYIQNLSCGYNYSTWMLLLTPTSSLTCGQCHQSWCESNCPKPRAGELTPHGLHMRTHNYV